MDLSQLTDVIAANLARMDRLEAALNAIVRLKPARGKKAAIRGALLQAQTLARTAVGSNERLGLDVYDSQR